ncbi:hypothetical protein JEQ12_013320 [Ovis aries]|uniref:Uncharacterized protein n=1 Tax=Ovis aries TaxID=9940 RepID=A0A835ZS77_SHEEP|nr:hypothetical protein JEQ12_013320 [Ovis aries]
MNEGTKTRRGTDPELNPENLVLGSTALITEVIGATAAWIHGQGKHAQRQQSILREDPVAPVFQRLGEREDMQKRLKEKKPQWFAQLHSFQCNGGQWNAIEIIDDVFGFPRSTASDKQPCDNDSLVSVIEENQQRSRKGDQEVKDGRQAECNAYHLPAVCQDILAEITDSNLCSLKNSPCFESVLICNTGASALGQGHTLAAGRAASRTSRLDGGSSPPLIPCRLQAVQGVNLTKRGGCPLTAVPGGRGELGLQQLEGRSGHPASGREVQPFPGSKVKSGDVNTMLTYKHIRWKLDALPLKGHFRRDLLPLKGELSKDEYRSGDRSGTSGNTDVHSVPCPLQAADVTGHQKREGDANQQVHARTRYLAPSNVHGIFRKTLLMAES